MWSVAGTLCLAAFTGLLFSDGATGLECYQCSSESDPECMENFDTGNTERFLQPTQCEMFAAKYCVKTTGIFGGLVGTRRFCSSRDLHNICQYITYEHHDRVYRSCVYTCTGDACNSASVVSISLLSFLLYATISLLM